jgi:hypothetical protein
MRIKEFLTSVALMSLNIFLKRIWFPIRKTFKIVKGKNDDDIKILGGTIQFDGDVRKISKPENTFRYYLSAIENR